MHGRSFLEHTLAVNVLTGPIHCKSPQDSNFIPLFHFSEIDRAWKHPLYSDLKSQDCFLTHWLLIPSLLAIIRGIYRNELKCIYFENQKLFVYISVYF